MTNAANPQAVPKAREPLTTQESADVDDLLEHLREQNTHPRWARYDRLIRKLVSHYEA
jgi:hypothetical protein